MINPVRSEFATADLAPATGVGTTWFCRTLKRRSSCAPAIAHEVQPALRSPWRADALASTASCSTFVTTRDRPSCRNRTTANTPVIWVCCEGEYFLRGDWTTQISLIWLAHAVGGRAAERTSALVPTTDSSRTWLHVRKVPTPDSCIAANCASFDHLVERAALMGRVTLSRSRPGWGSGRGIEPWNPGCSRQLRRDARSFAECGTPHECGTPQGNRVSRTRL